MGNLRIPHKNSLSINIDFLRRELDLHSSNYENFILLGDFNSEMTDSNLNDFCNLYLLKNLIKKPTCFKNSENPKTIDLILTNRPRSFCNSDTLETGLSDFHKLTVTVLKMFFKKESPNVISYRNYKNFSNDSFRTNLINEISNNGILEGDLTGFLDACKKSLNYQAPRKNKYTRANQASFLTKEINKEIMTRSRLRNKFLRCRSDGNKKAYNEQRNRCVKVVRSAKKAYHSNLSIKDVNDNKKIWEIVNLPHDLIVAKLHAYGFSIDSLKLINSYLTERKQRVKINDQFSSWFDIVVGVPQGSILGPLLFNIFLCDMFLFCNDIDFASYADDNTPYCIGKTPDEVIIQLEKCSKSIFEWFENNGMKANPDKCHLLLSKNENFEANINENRISNTRFEKLFGVTFDNQLNFNHHISKICKTASDKLHALPRVSNYIDEDKRRILFNSYFSSQFNYCPLIWMNQNKSINKKINNLHERALRLIYCDHSSDFQELLQRDNSVTIHQKISKH